MGHRVYIWSEIFGVTGPHRYLDYYDYHAYITSLSFSSERGRRSILAMGRINGQLSLWSPHENYERIQYYQSCGITCVAFKPVLGENNNEELLTGDELGRVYYYSIKWDDEDTSMDLVAKIAIHSQQICGISWSPSGDEFATGANDNLCLLFSVCDILGPSSAAPPVVRFIPDFVPSTHSHITLTSMLTQQEAINIRSFLERETLPCYAIRCIKHGQERHRWRLGAAVKAVAFCPWQHGLIAMGGGSHDRSVHFFHTGSGACLGTICVQAQVTSLVWSNTRHEIAVTLGYAHPEHPYRIAVFSWPGCKQVIAIPFNSADLRVICAIPFPGDPNEIPGSEKGKREVKGDRERDRWWDRTADEGCLLVACSDETVKFHEIWSGSSRSMSGKLKGSLGWSSILEELEGTDDDLGRLIR